MGEMKVGTMEKELPVVMVVDDNVASLQSALNVLSDICEVFTVPSADKMFDLLKRNKPKLILLDLNMPDVDGFEALRRLKDDPATRDIPVIMLTGVQAQESQLEGLVMGAADYITKPFAPQLLRKRVELYVALWEKDTIIKQQAQEIDWLTKGLR
jgi:CheY-like chemotaxis protein